MIKELIILATAALAVAYAIPAEAPEPKGASVPVEVVPVEKPNENASEQDDLTPDATFWARPYYGGGWGRRYYGGWGRGYGGWGRGYGGGWGGYGGWGGRYYGR